MKILALSDTHTLHKEWEKTNEHLLDGYIGIDMIIHSGDISHIGEHKQIDSFLSWFHSVPVKHKIFILGNHEKGMEGDEDWIRTKIQIDYPSLTFLHHEHITIEGVKIFGSPYTPYFHGWAYNVVREDLKYYWDEIESDTDIVVTHGPPFGVGDLVRTFGEITGCYHLLNKIMEIKPKVHQFGHIHEGAGKYRMQDSINTLFINAACVVGFPYNIKKGLNVYEVAAKEIWD